MKKQSGQTLAATMIVIVIIAILAVVFLVPRYSTGKKESPRKDKQGYTTLGLVRLSALDTKCQNDIQQLRIAIKMAHDTNGDEGYPADLQSTHLGEEFYSCPVGHEPYVYDPATGQVHCPHPGHERY